ncbi:restriction endonuclease subunit S [Caldibacillus thermoamylovorans]|uniref:Type I restriction-modification system, specificity subunit S n=1 Tax=Caldibacillus thermoamylovorans TaxID=35841 RepID=A0ABD4A8G7_9BACI|nr:restriction endonuclease subunit S [Caldibacillus thermoamylovorans]KIO72744.1 Type I restriction-modification system, specificity subunit S [Caldibacillus thermoamylovorans]
MKFSEWKVVKLEDVCYFGNDKIETKMISLEDYISTENMLPNKGGISIASSLPSTKAVRKYEKNDVLISNIRPYFKKIWFARKIGGASNDVLILKGRNKKILDNKFMYYYLSQDGFFSYVTATAKGTKMPRGDKTAIMNYKINLPTIQEQENIVRILTSLDEKIEINNEINKKLEEMAQAIFKHWFVDFEFPNENGEPYKSSGGEMVESELGMIPKGWKVTILDNIVNISTKSINPQNYAERVFEHYSIPALDNNKTPEIQMGKEIKSNKYLIDDNVILISKLNPNTKRIWKPIPQYKFAICSTEFIVYVPKENNIFYYVYEFINSDYFSEMLVSHATGSTGSRQRVKPKDTLNFKIYLPPVELMVKFSKAVKPMHDSISLKNLEIQKLVLTRDTLLPKLMSGEIRVPVEEEK